MILTEEDGVVSDGRTAPRSSADDTGRSEDRGPGARRDGEEGGQFMPAKLDRTFVPARSQNLPCLGAERDIMRDNHTPARGIMGLM